MNVRKIAGITAGVSGLVFLIFSVSWYLYETMAPLPPPWPGMRWAYMGIFVVFYLCNLFGMISAGLTKILLKRFKVFAAPFISLGLLNLFILTSMFYFKWFSPSLWVLLLYAPSTMTILVGVSLIKPLRMLVARQNIE